MSSIYERLGGEPAMDAAVETFYGHVLADDHIAKFFEAVDMDRQKRKQKQFLTMVFGGPNNYTGETMRKAHAPLVDRGLDDSHFDAVAGHLQSTLKELGIGDTDVNEVMTLAGSLRDDVLGRTSEPG